MHRTIFVELASKLGVRGTAGQPADQRANGQTDRKGNDQ